MLHEVKYEFLSYSLAKCIVDYYETSLTSEEGDCLIVKLGLHLLGKKKSLTHVSPKKV